jgi:hypothetical protein
MHLYILVNDRLPRAKYPSQRIIFFFPFTSVPRSPKSFRLIACNVSARWSSALSNWPANMFMHVFSDVQDRYSESHSMRSTMGFRVGYRKRQYLL